jgi:MoxR-like ATPase
VEAVAAERKQVEPMDPSAAAECAGRLRSNVERALRGKTEVVRRCVETLISGGHLLIEDVPGVGKTTLARALARSLDGSFSRIQFTSDLLPSDVLGASIPEMNGGRPTGEFVFQRGPLFSQVVLADEINRASPKTQSALLEAMSEGHVTLDGRTYPLPEPFFVVATQNPAEHYGANPLPESQLDRFRMRLGIGYPKFEDEAAVLRDDPGRNALPALEPVVSISELRAMHAAIEGVKLDDALVGYVLAIVGETRQHEAVHLGVSTRGALALTRSAQARALVDGRAFCIPEDVREIAVDVLTHRIVTDPRGGLRRGGEEAEWIVREVLEQVPVPL